MFKLTIPITKAFRKKNGKFVVEGIASDPTIDRDEERFDMKAIEQMAESVNKGSIPIRVEHENKVYTDVGSWLEGGINKENKLYVKGELDTELSLGKDMSVLLDRGEALGLSVGGRVFDAGFEYDEEAKKTIRVFKDVGLEEISIVKSPANYNASLGIGKSVDWEALEKIEKTNKGKKEIPYTTQAQKLIKMYKSMEKVTNEEFNGLQKKNKISTKSVTKWTKNTLKTLDPWFDELIKTVDLVCDVEEVTPRLLPEDLRMIGQLMAIMAQVDLPEDRPSILDTEGFWEDLVEEQQIVLFDRRMRMPHHNKNLSLNKELLLWYTKKVVDEQSYYIPKDYTVIIGHLYRHLKELALVKSKKEGKTKENMQKSSALTADELNLMKQCYEYKEGKTTKVPIFNSTKLSEIQIDKCAEAYKLFTNNPNTMVKNKKVKKEEVEEEEDKKVVVEEEEETKEETEEEEETKEETEEEEVKEEEETKEEVVDEEKEVEEEKEEEEEEEETKEEVEEETEEEEEEEEEETKKKVKKTVKKQAKMKVEKSVEQLTDIVENLVEKAKSVDTLENTVKALVKTVTKQTELLSEMTKVSLGRKSVAVYTAIEKGFQEPQKTEARQEEALKSMDEGASFKEAYIASKQLSE